MARSNGQSSGRSRSFLKRGLLGAAILVSVVLLLEILARCVLYQKISPHPMGIITIYDEVFQSLRGMVDRFQYKLMGHADPRDLKGILLNRTAWEASFKERGLYPPSPQPREGYWGSRLHPKRKHPFLRYTERQLVIPSLVYVDKSGFQYASVPGHEPTHSILILGGSVAFGAYASRHDHTYFSRLVRILAHEQIHVDVSVLAAGGWLSRDELVAFVLRGLDRRPDMVIFLNGINDLTNTEHDYSEGVRVYLRNMEKAKSIASAYGIVILFALQPFLPDKHVKTLLEKRILQLTKGAYDLAPFYDDIRKGLKHLSGEGNTFFVDCSGAFSHERYTTFADLWHFSDPAHAILAELLAREIGAIIKSKKGCTKGKRMGEKTAFYRTLSGYSQAPSLLALPWLE